MATGNEKTYTSQERLAQLHLAESLYDAGLYKSAQLIVRQENWQLHDTVISVSITRYTFHIHTLNSVIIRNCFYTYHRRAFTYARSEKTKNGFRRMPCTSMPAV